MSNSASRLALAAALATLLTSACDRGDRPAMQAPGTPERARPYELARELRVLQWEEYITAEVAADFAREYGVTLKLEVFSENEAAIERMKKGEVWDVWFPSDYAVQMAARDGLLSPLDHAALPNLKNVSRRFQNAIYDRKLELSVPYYWGMTGLGFDRRAFRTPPDSWSVIFDPAKRRAFKGKIDILDDMRETLGAALIYLGVNPNSTDPEHLGRARDLIRSLAADVHAFDSETYADALKAGTVALAHGWSDDIGRVAAENPARGFVLPREGFVLWVDNLAIPKASDRKPTSHVLINYLLRPEVAAKLTNGNHGPNAVAGAEAFVAPEIRESPGFSLPEGTPFFILRDLGEALPAVEKAWAEARSGGGR